MSDVALLGMIDRALGDRIKLTSRDLSAYRDDPVAFGEDILHERYAPDVAAMMRSVVRYPVTVAQSANAVGKTHGAARVAYWFYQCFPGAKVFTAAAPPLDNLERLLWGELGHLVARHGHEFPLDAVTNLYICRGADEFITGVTIPSTGSEHQRKSKFSGKHAPYILFIFDEGDAIPDDVYEATESCMSGGFARMLIMYNPHFESGAVWDMVRDGRANVIELSAFNHPNVLSGTDELPGAVTRAITLRRIAEWTEAVVGIPGPRDGDCYRVPEHLVGCRLTNLGGMDLGELSSGWRRIVDPQFSYMVLGRYPLTGLENAYFDRAWLSWVLRGLEEKDPRLKVIEMRDVFPGYSGTLEIYASPDPDMSYVMGVDTSEGIKSDDLEHDYSTIEVACGETWEHVASYWGRIDPTELGDVIDWLGKEYNGARVAIERSPHAVTTLRRLQELGYGNLYAHKVNRRMSGEIHEETQLGYPNTLRAKVVRDDGLARCIREASHGYSGIVLKSARAVRECMSYVKKPAGRAGGLGSHHDDHVTSEGLTVFLLGEGGVPLDRIEIRHLMEDRALGVGDFAPPEPAILYGR